MMARWLRWLVLGLAAGAAGSLAWAWQAGWGWPALLLLALAWALPHGPVMALQLVLLAVVSRAADDRSAPPASASQLLRAGLRELWVGLKVFGGWQAFCADDLPDLPDPPGPQNPPAPPGVLLVHGFVCNRGLWRPWLARLRAHGVPVRAVNLEPVFGRIDGHAPTLQAAVDALWARTGQAPLVVAHSMGGLAVRAWLREPGAAQRVRHVITIGTPHQGTWLARWSFSPNGRQMRLANAWLQALAADEARHTPAPATYAHFTCYFGHADHIVFPPGVATLPGADNRHLPATAHVDLVYHPAVWAEVARRLGLR